jgi:hypothetical protein
LNRAASSLVRVRFTSSPEICCSAAGCLMSGLHRGSSLRRRCRLTAGRPRLGRSEQGTGIEGWLWIRPVRLRLVA